MPTGALINQRYLLGAEIGRGGMGVVYRAQDTLLERAVAVKLLDKSALGSEGSARLLHEAQSAAALNHPNIITIHDAGESPDGPFIVMELLEGKALSQYQPSGVEEIVSIARQLCAALQHAHTHGIIHRDLKPENVLVTSEGVTKLMDFGLALSVASRLTVEGSLVGTVFYLAPEQALGKGIDARTDLYALGVMLYELATGGLPFVGDDPFSVITQHLNAPLVPPRARNDAIPPALDGLIVRLLSKAPDDRPASAAEVERLLAVSLEPSAGILEQTPEISLLERIVHGRIVGRVNELAEAGALWERSRHGEGQLLLVSGEPGVGKSRLARELVTRAGVSRGVAFVGECYAEGGAPYAPFAQILRQALEDGAAPHDLPDFVLADLLELAPDLRLRFPAVPPNPPLDAQSVQARLFENVLTLCQALCQRGPLLLLLEDAHWADSGTLKLFHHLARRGRGMPLMLLSTYREVELDETLPMQALLHDLNRERLGVRIKLERLDENGTRDMLAALFDEEVTPEFLHAIYRETEGNPFFIEEVCKALVESGRLYYRDGRWQRPEVNELEIPQSVRVAIQSRVGQLPGAVQEILNIAAILGREFDYQTLAQASQAGEESLIEALEKAEDADLIQETSAREGVTFRFTHALIPDTLAGGIHTLRRRRMHQQAARAIEVLRPLDFEALAHHFVEAGDLQPAQIYHVRAGERAATAYANAEAEMHFQAALDLAGSDDERGRLLAELGRVRARMSRYELAIQDDLQAAELFSRLGDLDRAAGLYAHAALSAWDGGETERGLEIANQGLVRATPAQPGRGYAELLSEVGRAAYFNGQHEDSRKFCQQALRLGEELSLPGVQAGALITLGLLPGQAGEISIELLEKAARISEAAGLTRQAHRALHDLCVLSFDQPGKWREARQYGLRAAELARKRGALSDELHSWVTLAYSYILPGEYQALEPILDRMRELDLLIGGDTTGVRYAKYLEASLWHCRGELERASEALYSIQEAFRKTGDLQGLISLNKDLAEIHMEIGEFAPAETALREAIQVAESGIEPLAIPYHAALSQLLARQGRVDEARPLLELARHKKPDSDLVIWEALAIYAAAAELSAAEARAASAAADLMAEEECWGRAWQDYRWLAEYLEKLEMPWQRARTLREWAEAHLRRGSPQDVQQARLLLEEAGDIFAGLGVDYYARQVEERLKQLS